MSTDALAPAIAGNRTTPGRVRVTEVRTRRDRRAFIELPWRLYADDPAWIPPLRLERKWHCSRANPFFRHGSWSTWLAWRGDEPAGRISAQVDRLHRERYGADTGHFGLLEAVDDGAVFAALFGAAEDWLRRHGARRITGPFSLSINQESGVLVEGFEHPPVFMMPQGRPWYAGRIEEQGYAPVKDLLAYWIEVDFEAPRVMRALVERYAGRVRIRPLRRRDRRADMEILRDIFNDAWSRNWGFVPFTRAEFAELGSSLRLLVPEGLVQIAEVDREPAAFIVGLPNLNEAWADLDGSLLPFGLVKLLWRLKREHIRTGRVPLMGVRRRFQNTPLGMALAFLVIDAVRKELLAHGIREVEMSWILEDNSGMRSILDSIGSRLYKRYRLYSRELGPAVT